MTSISRRSGGRLHSRMRMVDLDKDSLVVVGGGGGFIGGHLVAELRRLGHRRIRTADIKPSDQWFQCFPDVDSRQLDLRDRDASAALTKDARYVFNLACDMGGMGFIET